MAAVAPVVDPNVAALKKRLYTQAGTPAAAAAPAPAMISPDFAPSGGFHAGVEYRTQNDPQPGTPSAPVYPMKPPPPGPGETPPWPGPELPNPQKPPLPPPGETPPFPGPRAEAYSGYGNPVPPSLPPMQGSQHPMPGSWPPIGPAAAPAPPTTTSPRVSGGPVARTGLEPPAAAAAPTGDYNLQLVTLLNQGLSPEAAVAQLVQQGAKPGSFNIKKDGTIGYRDHGNPEGIATGYIARSKNANEGDWAYGRSGYLLNGEVSNWRDPWGNPRTDPRPGESTASASAIAPPTATKTAEITGTNNLGGPAYGTPGSGVPGVYDFDNAGNPIDAFGAPYTGPLTGGPNPNAAPANDFNAQIRAQLMARLKELGLPVDENAAGIKQAVSAASDENERSLSRERTELAERLYAQGGGGLNSNALTQGIQQSREKGAGALSSLRANLLMGEYARKQSALQQTLTLAVQSGDAEAARAAQKAIADLQAQLQREGFGIDLAKYQAYLNQNAVAMGLG